MSTDTVRLHRWDEIALEKVTEMLSRKIVTGGIPTATTTGERRRLFLGRKGDDTSKATPF